VCVCIWTYPRSMMSPSCDAVGASVFGEESDELRRVVLGLLNETKNVVLNFAWVGQLDSNGLGALVASFISARHHGARIKFAALSPSAKKVLTPTRVEDLFEVTILPMRRLDLFMILPIPQSRKGAHAKLQGKGCVNE
jgi:anti-anti-sigma regulatory factor